MKPAAVFYDPAFLLHDTGAHPENPARLTSIVDTLKHSSFAQRLAWPKFGPASLEDLTAVHTEKHVAYIQASCLGGSGNLDPDTVVCPASWEAAKLAAGAACAAVNMVMKGEYGSAFCAVRPPGHHAEPARAMGFCLFNNIAVAARRAITSGLAKRVAIIDFDVHHGNGTQAAFYEDPNVFFVSLHLAGHYPGTGWTDETGAEAGIGTTLNIPMSAGSGDQEYMDHLETIALPAVKKFGPNLIMVSAGFDAHAADPLGGMSLSTQGYYNITSTIKSLADEVCDGKVVSVLEGGYNIKALCDSAEAHVKALLGL
ncbi:MAG: histone deacetylase [Nitrospinota bacterium]|nr:histone deacetylase [Nitrospinota bacterium]